MQVGSSQSTGKRIRLLVPTNSQTSQTTSDVAVIEHEGLSLIWLGEDMRRSHHLWSIHFFFLSCSM